MSYSFFTDKNVTVKYSAKPGSHWDQLKESENIMEILISYQVLIEV